MKAYKLMMLAMAAALVLGLQAQPAWCSYCVGTPCGFSSECDRQAGCVCAIPNGEVRGTCVGSR